ncbi:hypothetical protein E9993_22940, partial [Labilibacter sediminis]
IWDHLDRLYTQSNFAKQYQLEFDIRALQQNSLSVQEFYAAMSDLWDQLALTEPAELKAFKPYVDRRESQRLVQFLMALRSDFEGLRGSILHRNPLPTVDSVVHELIAEETRLKSTAAKDSKPITPAVLAVTSSRSQSSNQNRPRVAQDECAFCRKKGHWKSQCPMLKGNQQQQQPAQQQVKAPAQSSGQSRFPKPPQYAAAAPTAPADSDFTPPSALDPTVLEEFKRFLANNPSAMSVSVPHSGLSSSSTSGIPSSLWILDSGASHHMSPYKSSFVSMSSRSPLSVMSASSTPMSVEGVGSIVTPYISLSDVYFIPTLALNLASVSQLCKSGCWVFFYDEFCCVQGARSRRVIGIGRRLGG